MPACSLSHCGKQERRLILARDRMGEKPLYYGWQNGTLVFGSELKALRAHPSFMAEFSREALCLLLRHNYIPGPYTIYADIMKLPAGCFLSVEAGGREGVVEPYWSLRTVVADGEETPFQGDETEAVNELERLLCAAVRAQSVADVPLGALLSGGIDLSTVVALDAGECNPLR